MYLAFSTDKTKYKSEYSYINIIAIKFASGTEIDKICEIS